MQRLSHYLFKLVWRRKTTLLGLLASSVFLGLFARYSFQQFLYLQAQNMSGLSVFNEVVIPLAGLTLLLQICVSLFVTLPLFPGFVIAQQASLLQQSSLSPSKRLTAIIQPVLILSSWPLINLGLIIFVLGMHTQFDWARLGLLLFGLFIINIICSLIILWVCLRSRNLLLASLQSFLLLLGLISIEMLVNFWGSYSFWHGIFSPFFTLREGSIVYADFIAYVGWIILFASSCYYVLSKATLQQNKQQKKQYSLSIIIALLLIIMADFSRGQKDITSNQRNTIASNVIDNIREIDQPLLITAMIDSETNREEILRGFHLLQRELSQAKLVFQSRQNLAPEHQHAGEYIQFKLGDLEQFVSYPFKHEIKTVFELALKQMLLRKKQWITFIEGHGEASPFNKESSDLSILYQSLTARGWPIAAQSLALMPVITDNTALLVIATSKQQWLPKEVAIVEEYLQRGGHLLILTDPESMIPKAIEKIVGLSRLPGTLVDWKGYQSGTPHPAIVIVNDLKIHPIVDSLNSYLAFPWASGLQLIDKKHKSNIDFKVIVQTHKGVWNELDIGAENLSFDKNKGEQQGVFALAISRYDNISEQKIIVVGDSSFASNSAINNYSNKQFALNLISWLVNVDPKFESNLLISDNNITPSLWGYFVMNWGFSLILPLILLFFWLITGLRWYKRAQ